MGISGHPRAGLIQKVPDALNAERAGGKRGARWLPQELLWAVSGREFVKRELRITAESECGQKL